MEWRNLSQIEQLNDVVAESETRPVLLFKHSTRCSISDVAWKRVKDANLPPKASYYYLDLLSHRDISNKIAELFSVHHESPQVLLIRSKDCVYTESHLGITADEITEQVNSH